MRIIWAAAVVTCIFVALGALGLAATSLAGSTNRAGLVVTLPDRTETLWVEFSEEQITGAELLRRSGLAVTFSGFGGLGQGVCAIEEVGCFDPGDCWCQCKSGTCKYWVYFRAEQGGWIRSPVGPSSRKLRDGDVDGWVWGSGAAPEGSLTPVPCPTPTEAPLAVPPPAEPGAPAATVPSDATQGRAPAATAGTNEAAPASTAPPAVAVASGSPSEPPPFPSRTPQASTAVGRIVESGLTAGDLAADPDSGGAPIGLLAFGGVAAVMVVAIGAVVARRRRRG